MGMLIEASSVRADVIPTFASGLSHASHRQPVMSRGNSTVSRERPIIRVASNGLFLILWLMSTRIATQARDKAGALMVVGTLGYLFWHVIVNMGMVIGLMPIVGVPMPLLSYGGTSLLTTMVGLGMISSVAYRRYLF